MARLRGRACSNIWSTPCWRSKASAATNIASCAHLVQPRLDRRQPLCLDRRSVEKGGIGAADLAVRIALCRLQYVARALLRQVGEFGEHAIVRLVGRDRRRLRPRTVRIGIEHCPRPPRPFPALGVASSGAPPGPPSFARPQLTTARSTPY